MTEIGVGGSLLLLLLLLPRLRRTVSEASAAAAKGKGVNGDGMDSTFEFRPHFFLSPLLLLFFFFEIAVSPLLLFAFLWMEGMVQTQLDGQRSRTL